MADADDRLQISELEFNEECFVLVEKKYSAVTVFFEEPLKLGGRSEIFLSDGVNKFSVYEFITSTYKSITYSDLNSEVSHSGVYKIQRIKNYDFPYLSYILPKPNTATVTFTLRGTPGEQLAEQEVIEGDYYKNTFKIIFTKDMYKNVGGPVIYADSEGKKPIADCNA